MLKLVVIDGQGGGLGKNLIEKIIKANVKDVDIIALGTNALATASMIKAGARTGATGENAIMVNAEKADVIMGPIAVVIPNSIMGEITQGISLAVGKSDAMKILIPLNRCNVEIPGTARYTVTQLLDSAVEELNKYQESMNS